jgi:hypothetical protein
VSTFKEPGTTFLPGGEKRRGGSVQPAASSPNPPRQALAPLQHGGRSTVALAPTVRGVKRELCKRLGVRYADLDAAGREAVDLYSRARAKLAAIDTWLERNPMLNEKGEPAACMPLYATLLNTSNRLLASVLTVLSQMAKEDDRYDAAVQALIAEGHKTKAGRGAGREEKH